MLSKKVKEFLKKNKIDYEIKDGQIYVGGSLWLGGLTSIPEGIQSNSRRWLVA